MIRPLLRLAQFDRAFFVRVNQALTETNGCPVEAQIGPLVRELVPDLRRVAEPLTRRGPGQGAAITGIEFHGETVKAPGVNRLYNQ